MDYALTKTEDSSKNCARLTKRCKQIFSASKNIISTRLNIKFDKHCSRRLGNNGNDPA